MAISLRLPESTKRRVEKLARNRDTTAHAFMVAAIEDRLTAEENRAAFQAEAEKRALEFRKTGKAIPAQDVFDYLQNRVKGSVAPRPRTRKVL